MDSHGRAPGQRADKAVRAAVSARQGILDRRDCCSSGTKDGTAGTRAQFAGGQVYYLTRLRAAWSVRRSGKPGSPARCQRELTSVFGGRRSVRRRLCVGTHVERQSGGADGQLERTPAVGLLATMADQQRQGWRRGWSMQSGVGGLDPGARTGLTRGLGCGDLADGHHGHPGTHRYGGLLSPAGR